MTKHIPKLHNRDIITHRYYVSNQIVINQYVVQLYYNHAQFDITHQ